MVKKRQANLERFSGSIAELVGGKQKKNRAGHTIGKPKFELSRKKARKLKKEAKKEKRINHSLIKAGAELPVPDQSEKKLPFSNKKKKIKQQNQPGKESIVSLQSKMEKVYKPSSGSKMSKEEAEIANKKEDKVIKGIEKRLGFNKKKTDKNPKSIEADGLGYVLNFKDESDKQSKQKELAESAANDLFQDLDSDDEGEDFIDSDMEDEEQPESEFVDDAEDDKLDQIYESDESDETDDLTDNVNMETSTSINQMDHESDDEENENSNDVSADNDGCDVVMENTPSSTALDESKSMAYVPPHLRGIDSHALLKRKIRGYVNKVSTSNIKQILFDIELVYQDFARGDVNKAILTSISESCLISTIMPARLCAEHMLLIACLSSNIGPEFVSPLLEDLAQQFSQEMNERHGKILNNIVSMICFLYALKVVSCTLVFDIIQILLKSFKEADLEVLLYIFKSVGLDIRKDDPQALKNIVQIVNEAGAKTAEKTSRFVWFVDTLTAVKNNNVNKITNYDKSDITDIQKAYKAAVKGAPNNLQVTLSDLIDAKTKGRWWIVGAAWTGAEEKKKVDQDLQFDSKLLVLAKKNHMSTEVRRNVFCVLMSSQDYEHCFEKMLKLSIKDKQEREIIYVTMLCALKCKSFNPYYTNVIKKFCQYSKNYQITTQFSIWDRLKDLKSLTPLKIQNFIQLLSLLLSSKTISLAVLKIVNFAEIGSEEVDFFKVLFHKLLNESEVMISETFGRLQPLPLDSLKNGIKVFMKHFLKPELKPEELKNMKIAMKCF